MQSGASTSMGVVNPTDLLTESISMAEAQRHSKASLKAGAARTSSTKQEGKPRQKFITTLNQPPTSAVVPKKQIF